MAVPPENPAAPESLSVRIALLEQKLDTTNQILKSVSDSIGRLVRLEERHCSTSEALARAFKQINAQGERLDDIERKLPGLLETRGWIVAATLGIAAVVGLAVIKLVLM